MCVWRAVCTVLGIPPCNNIIRRVRGATGRVDDPKCFHFPFDLQEKTKVPENAYIFSDNRTRRTLLYFRVKTTSQTRINTYYCKLVRKYVIV